MHPALLIGLAGSFLFFLGVAISVKRTVPVALIYAAAGLVIWFVLLLLFNFAPKAIPFVDLPFLGFLGAQYFILFGIVPASLITVAVGLRVRRAAKDASSRMGRFGARALDHPLAETMSKQRNFRRFGYGVLLAALLPLAIRFIALPMAVRASLRGSDLAQVKALNALTVLQGALDVTAALCIFFGAYLLWRSKERVNVDAPSGNPSAKAHDA